MIAQTKVDAAVSVGAFTSPWWLPIVERIVSSGASVVMWIAGFILIALRIWIAIRDIRRRK